MRIMNVVGARPQFVKVAPVVTELDRRGMENVLVHTGQHYDEALSAAMFSDLGLRAPDRNLGVGSGSHARQTADTLVAVEAAILELHPDAVVVYGDTNPTLAAALAAAKLHVTTAHVEAGLRSRNRLMPEELNRVAVDHLADLLLAPTANAVANLETEGLGDRTRLTGDVMADLLRSIDLDAVDRPDWAAGGDYILCTVHRAENTDDPDRLRLVLRALADLPLPVVLPAHPRLLASASAAGLSGLLDAGSLRVVEPLPYSQMLAAVAAAETVVTDSGGLQKEAYLLGVPCVTLRSDTEWPETLIAGWNVLAGHRLDELPDLVQATPDAGGWADFFPAGTSAAAAIVDAVSSLKSDPVDADQ